MRLSPIFLSMVLALCPGIGLSHDRAREAVDAVIRPLMSKDGIPGMAVGDVVDGHARVFDYGVASLRTHSRVTPDTLFEIGSISKTFTATLASYAVLTGHMKLSDRVRQYFPSLRGTPFGDEVSLLNLGTHTPGGMPVQVPSTVRTRAGLMAYLRAWRPLYPPGSHRTYSNIGIGLLGLAAARSLHQRYAVLLQERLLAPLGLKNTFLDVPAARAPDYAEGYTSTGKPIRMRPGCVWRQACGIRTTAGDLTRFLQLNMRLIRSPRTLAHAALATHTAYFTAGGLTQDLIWEQYRFPVTLPRLLEGNAPSMLYQAVPAREVNPARAPQQRVWLNKTGSTNGFSAYVAFVPETKLGIVILANKSYAMDDRVAAGYEILTALTTHSAGRLAPDPLGHAGGTRAAGRHPPTPLYSKQAPRSRASNTFGSSSVAARSSIR